MSSIGQLLHEPLQVFFWSDVQHSFQGSVNPDLLYKVEVFQGVFLDAGLVVDSTSLLFSLTIFPSVPQLYLGSSWLSAPLCLLWFAHIARLSSSSLSLVPLPSMFSVYVALSTSMNVHMITSPQSIGPLYPFANYNILNSLLLAGSSYCAIALLCCFILFPETVNHVFLGIVSTILDKVQTMLSVQDSLLSPQPSDFGPKCPKSNSLLQIRAAIAGMYQTSDYPFIIFLGCCSRHLFSVMTLTVHLKGEFSVGRWNGDDASRLANPLLAVIFRMSKYFYLAVNSLPEMTMSRRWIVKFFQTCLRPTCASRGILQYRHAHVCFH